MQLQFVFRSSILTVASSGDHDCSIFLDKLTETRHELPIFTLFINYINLGIT